MNLENMNLIDMSIEEIASSLPEFPKFRAKQVYEWINKGAYIGEMNNIPKALKEKLVDFDFLGTEIINIDDEFKTVVKHLNKLHDNNVVESVLMNYKHGNSLCVSSQVGCAMDCAFCASTIGGVVRNVKASEMFFTVARLNERFKTNDKRGVTNIVIMGSGEPLLNLKEVVPFINMCSDRLNISKRNISVSTCGIVEGIVKLADENLGINLCLSLHAPNDEIRQKIMPIAKKYTLKETLNAMDYYYSKTKRRLIFEYVLIKDVNDSIDNAKELVELLKGKNAHVNLIPYNKVEELSFNSPSQKTVDTFLNTLVNGGISATKRRELGDNIDGACGQLRRKYLK